MFFKEKKKKSSLFALYDFCNCYGLEYAEKWNKQEKSII